MARYKNGSGRIRRRHWQKPVYDWVQPKTVNFLVCLLTGISGGLSQGSNGPDMWLPPNSTMKAINYMMFGGPNG